MIDPLRITFIVECPPEHAFHTWTERASAWWPPAHTASHDPGTRIVFEPRVGGQIYERTSTGQQIPWGEITAWEPPHRLAYRWHIATRVEEATDVEIRFRRAEFGATEVTIEHSGWERLGERGQTWRDANQGGWRGVLPGYLEACLTERTKPDPPR